MLILALHNGRIVGVSTAIPLVSPSDITTGAPELFEQNGLNPSEFYYYGEIIILPEYRGHKLSEEMYAIHEKFAKSWGFKQLCLCVVNRRDEHPQMPSGYRSLDRHWQQLGFARTNMSFDYEWPTLQVDGSIINQANAMIFWVKELP